MTVWKNTGARPCGARTIISAIQRAEAGRRSKFKTFLGYRMSSRLILAIVRPYLKIKREDSSVMEHLLNMCKPLLSILSTRKKRGQGRVTNWITMLAA